MFQQTLCNSVSFEGYGVHSNEYSKITIQPAKRNSGIQFALNNFNNKIIQCNLNSIHKTHYCLSLGDENHHINTVEHLLSALYGLGITNCLIEIEGKEIPILDGSAYRFVDNIVNLNPLIKQGIEADTKSISFPIAINKNQSAIFVFPNDILDIYAIIDFPHPLLTKQVHHFIYTQDKYISTISNARTFGFLSQWDSLKKSGYALGSNLNNTLVFDSTNIVNPPLRYQNEPVRHKILDFIGSLALLNCRITGSFYLYCSGHALDIQFLNLLDKVINKKIPDDQLAIIKSQSEKIINKIKHHFKD